MRLYGERGVLGLSSRAFLIKALTIFISQFPQELVRSPNHDDVPAEDAAADGICENHHHQGHVTRGIA
jgi:hypothetical protein